MAVRNFVEESLEHDEEIQGPVLLADNVQIMTEGNSTIAKETGPIVEQYNNVYCINTNDRIIFARTGINKDSTVEELTRTGLASGFWTERKGVRVSSEISHGIIFHSIKKGEIFNIHFDSGLKGTTGFFTAETKPIAGLFKFFGVMGFLLLLIGVLFSVIRIYGQSINILLLTFGSIFLVLAIVFAVIKKLVFSSPVAITLENTSNMTAVVRNLVETSKRVTIKDERTTEETINYTYDVIYLKVRFNEMVTSKQLQDFVHILKSEKIPLPAIM